MRGKSPIRTRHGMATALASLALLGGCMQGPKYVQPTTDAPAAFKEDPNWKPAQPGDAAFKGNWWELYGDPQLNALEARIAVSNQTLKAAVANYDQARAAVRIARSGLFPTVTASPSASRTRGNAHRILTK